MNAVAVLTPPAHVLLAECRTIGEWFSCSSEVAVAAVERAIEMPRLARIGLINPFSFELPEGGTGGKMTLRGGSLNHADQRRLAESNRWNLSERRVPVNPPRRAVQGSA